MQNYRNESIDNLFKVMLNLKSIDECYDFFEDLCTVKEILDMAQRFETAVLLNDGCSYQKISENIGISTATISRVNRSLNYGSGGYKKAIQSLGEEQNDN